jgi:hypothetical protein
VAELVDNNNGCVLLIQLDKEMGQDEMVRSSAKRSMRERVPFKGHVPDMETI